MRCREPGVGDLACCGQPWGLLGDELPLSAGAGYFVCLPKARLRLAAGVGGGGGPLGWRHWPWIGGTRRAGPRPAGIGGRVARGKNSRVRSCSFASVRSPTSRPGLPAPLSQPGTRLRGDRRSSGRCPPEAAAAPVPSTRQGTRWPPLTADSGHPWRQLPAGSPARLRTVSDAAGQAMISACGTLARLR